MADAPTNQITGIDDETIAKWARELAPQTLQMPTDPTAPSLSAQDAGPQINRLQQQSLRQSEPKLSPDERAAALKQEYVEENQIAGVPLDVESGAPLFQRFMAAGKQPDDAFAYWQRLYGENHVRKDSRGNLIITVQGKDGKPKEIAVEDYSKLTVGDLAEFVGGGLFEMVGSIIGSALPGGKGKNTVKAVDEILSTARRVKDFTKLSAASAAGAAIGGAAGDVLHRSLENRDLQMQEIATRRAAQIVPDMMMDYGLFGALKAAGKLKSVAMHEIPEITARGIVSADKLGVPLSRAERTGNSWWRSVEAYLAGMPGSKEIAEQFRSIQAQAIGRAQTGVIGDVSKLPTHERLALEIQEALQEVNAPIQKFVDRAKLNTFDRLAASMNDMLSKATTTQRLGYKSEIAEIARKRTQAEHQAFQVKNEANYTKAYSLPGGETRVLRDDKLASEAQKMIESLPGKDAIETVEEGLDDLGQPILRDEVGRKMDRVFVPADVRRFLTELAANGGETRSLRDMVQMRTTVDNKIKEGAFQGVNNKKLIDIREMLTASINRTTKNFSGELHKAWKFANDSYEKGRRRYDANLIQNLLKKPGEAGYQESAKLVDNIVTGSDDSIRVLKEFFGKDSNEFKMVGRAVMDDVIGTALDRTTAKVNVKSLVNNLERFQHNNKEAFDTIFGKFGDDFINRAKSLDISQSDNVSQAVIEAGIKDPRQLSKLRQVMHAERQLKEVYQNQFLKMAGTAMSPGPGFDPKNFIDIIIDSASPKQAKAFIEKLPPGHQDNLRTMIMENLFTRAERAAQADDVFMHKFDPSRPLNPTAMESILKDRKKRDVLESVFGEDKLKELQDIGNVLRTISQSTASAKSAGGLAGGSVLNQAFHFQVGKLIPGFVWRRAAAFMLTQQPLVERSLSQTARQAAGSTPFTDLAFDVLGETPRLSYTAALTPDQIISQYRKVVFSTPFIKGLLNEFGEEGTYKLLEQTKLGLSAFGANQQEWRANKPDSNAISDDMLREWIKKN